MLHSLDAILGDHWNSFALLPVLHKVPEVEPITLYMLFLQALSLRFRVCGVLLHSRRPHLHKRDFLHLFKDPTFLLHYAGCCIDITLKILLGFRRD